MAKFRVVLAVTSVSERTYIVDAEDEYEAGAYVDDNYHLIVPVKIVSVEESVEVIAVEEQ